MMQSDRKTCLTGAALALAVALLISAVTLFILLRVVLPRIMPERAEEPQFVLAEWEGRVAVFEGGCDYPMQVYDVYVQALPEEERRALAAGIPAADADALSVLLEDYTG